MINMNLNAILRCNSNDLRSINAISLARVSSASLVRISQVWNLVKHRIGKALIGIVFAMFSMNCKTNLEPKLILETDDSAYIDSISNNVKYYSITVAIRNGGDTKIEIVSRGDFDQHNFMLYNAGNAKIYDTSNSTKASFLFEGIEPHSSIGSKLRFIVPVLDTHTAFKVGFIQSFSSEDLRNNNLWNNDRKIIDCSKNSDSNQIIWSRKFYLSHNTRSAFDSITEFHKLNEFSTKMGLQLRDSNSNQQSRTKE